MMWKNILWVLMLVCFSACSTSDDPKVEPTPEPEPVETAPLTVLAYLVANNNLDDDLLANIGTMYDGLATMNKQATLLVYWDGITTIGDNKATHVILKYEADGKGNVNGLPALQADAPLDDVLEVGEIVKEYTTQLSTSKEVMTKVLKDMVALSPTERVGFVAGSHGSSWLHTIYTTGSRAFGQDGKGTDNSIVLKDIVASMSSTGKKFDFLLFDACYMGSVEVCHEFKDVVDYQILSVMEVPAYGFPYDTFMPDLYKGNIEGYKNVCDAYIDYYNESHKAGNSAWATIALIDSKEVSPLVGAIKEQITTHTDALADYNVSGLQEYGRSSGQHIAYDLGHFVSDLNGGQMPDAFKAQLDKTILYKGCLEKARPTSYSVDPANYCGLGIYIPVSTRSKWNDYFKTLDWYTASGWNEVTFSWNF